MVSLLPKRQRCRMLVIGKSTSESAPVVGEEQQTNPIFWADNHHDLPITVASLFTGLSHWWSMSVCVGDDSHSLLLTSLLRAVPRSPVHNLLQNMQTGCCHFKSFPGIFLQTETGRFWAARGWFISIRTPAGVIRTALPNKTFSLRYQRQTPPNPICLVVN